MSDTETKPLSVAPSPSSDLLERLGSAFDKQADRVAELAMYRSGHLRERSMLRMELLQDLKAVCRQQPRSGAARQGGDMSDTKPPESQSVVTSALLVDMQRCLIWMEHENRCAEREEKMGHWLTDYSEALGQWDNEYMKARYALGLTIGPMTSAVTEEKSHE